MANRRWVKIWHEILSDHDFQDMTLEMQARWYNLLVFTSLHGKKGTIEIKPPARSLMSILQYQNYEEMIAGISQLKNISVTAPHDNGKITVTFSKWSKYQIDTTSYERLKRYRKTLCDNGDDNDNDNGYDNDNDNGLKNKNKNKNKIKIKIKNKIKNKEKEKEKEKILLPPKNVSKDIWDMFVEHRKEKRAPIKEKAYKLICDKLDLWEKEGYLPDDILKRSIENGWTGIFKPNEKTFNRAEPTANTTENQLEKIRKYKAELMEKGEY